MVQNF
jgi:hypothetical protein